MLETGNKIAELETIIKVAKENHGDDPLNLLIIQEEAEKIVKKLATPLSKKEKIMELEAIILAANKSYSDNPLKSLIIQEEAREAIKILLSSPKKAQLVS